MRIKINSTPDLLNSFYEEFAQTQGEFSLVKDQDRGGNGEDSFRLFAFIPDSIKAILGFIISFKEFTLKKKEAEKVNPRFLIEDSEGKMGIP